MTKQPIFHVSFRILPDFPPTASDLNSFPKPDIYKKNYFPLQIINFDVILLYCTKHTTLE